MGKALELINKLNVVQFDWKNTKESDVGFIAEEVEKVFPEAVFYNSQGEVEGLKLMAFVALLVEALKEVTNGNNIYTKST